MEMTGSPGMEMSPSVLHGPKCRACGNFGYACTLQPGLREVGGPSGAIAVIDSCIGRRYFRGRLGDGRTGPEAFPGRVTLSHIVRRKPVKAVEENAHILGP